MTPRRLLSLLIVAIMAVSCLAGCGTAGGQPSDTILVIGVDATFQERWNPFMVESAYDHQVMNQIFTPVMIINDKNELEPYGGNVKTEKTDDGGLLCTVTINKNMKFTDGTPVTIDDYIYGIYVRSDPSYTGPSSMLASNIEGIEEFYYDDPNYSTALTAIEAEAEAYKPENITVDQFIEYAKDTNVDGQWDAGAAQDIIDYLASEGVDVSALTADNADAVLDAFARHEYEAYREYYGTYEWYLEKKQSEYAKGNIAEGVTVSEISGVKKVNDYSCTVKYTKIDIYADRGLATHNGLGDLIPAHYYGEYTKGDVSAITKNSEPMGSGPYVWGGFADNIATVTANTEFFKGVPKTGTVRWQYIPQEDIIQALASGQIDIANPTGKISNIDEMKAQGIKYDLIDNAGYGYMGMNTTKQPLEVRKAIWSLMNRQPSVEGYYGPELAKVIERPMTTVLAEYPQDATTYYPYSREKALEYFNAAGYTQVDGKLVDASGNQFKANVYIGGSGKGEHPAYAMLSQASDDVKALGGELQIQDVDFATLQAAMNDGTADMFILAWSAVDTCDKTTQFHSTGGQNRYKFSDKKMDNLLETIVQTIDLKERKKLVSEMLDYAMENCIELPLYQRKNILAYNTANLNMATIPTATAFYNYEQVLWKVETSGTGGAPADDATTADTSVEVTE